MLKRSLATSAVLVVVAVALTACNFGSSGLSVLNHIVSRPAGSPGSALADTSVGQPAPETIAQTADLTAPLTIALTTTQTAEATATPLDISSAPILTPTMQAGAVESTAADEPIATPAVLPSVTIVFPTPEETETPELNAITPEMSPMEAPAPTSTPRPTPTALPSSGPAPTEPLLGGVLTPTQPTRAAGAPELVWLNDSQGFRQSKVMGWGVGQSFPITMAGKSNVTALITSFDVSVSGAQGDRGAWLAYTLTGSPYIFEAEIGGQQRKIAPPRPGWRFRLPKWSPTGDRLAFVAESMPLPGAPPMNLGLWTSAPDGSDMRQVVRGDGGPNQGVTFADWQPGGQELVYAFSGPGGLALSQWLSVPITGGAPRLLPLSGTLYDVSPDGSWLLGDGYTEIPPVTPVPAQAGPQNRRDHSYSVLMRIPTDGKTAPTLLTPACWSDTEGQISPDGNRVIALSWPSVSPACPRVSGQPKYELWVMNSDGSGRVALDAKNIIGREFPQWSVDGQAVYYQVWGAKGPEIWQADASGTLPPAALPGTLGADRFRVVQ